MHNMNVSWKTFDLVPVTRKVLNLQQVMSTMPQVELSTENVFHAGMLFRQVFCPEGTTFVGKRHKVDHFFLVLSGTLELTCGEKVETVTGPCIVKVKGDTKKAAFAVTDCMFATIHTCNATTVEDAEDELIEPEDMRLFDAHNKLIREVT